jgi:hypothetical protein
MLEDLYYDMSLCCRWYTLRVLNRKCSRHDEITRRLILRKYQIAFKSKNLHDLLTRKNI